ncbi:hypothetical protein [Aquabacterium sp. OR-4]|uniref:hypothetical protein n=1 Tax=Aquabacterium sp. OR-4 TaxID=2978127 RepID=UPI0021B474FD|nr:hypothetical protein [Aquabacterium sp. OR-4]MDT7837962.1 hypothetical protein [Aquabacterium sp. OR-4]
MSAQGSPVSAAAPAPAALAPAVQLHAVAPARPQAWQFSAGGAQLWLATRDGAAPGVPACAAAAAVALEQAAELLDALAACGLVPEDAWHWPPAPGTSAPGMPTPAWPPGMAHGLWQGAQAQARLALPWPLLRGLGVAPALAGLQWQPALAGLQWQPALAESLLAEWWLLADELQALEPGGLLLLPGPAGTRLRAIGEAATATAAPAGPTPPGTRHCQLVCRWPTPLPLAPLLGWQAWDGPASPPPPATCLLIDAASPATVLARGRLLPWGSGQALRIDAS